MSVLRVVFMGTAPFAVPSLGALLDAGHDVAAVYTQPARPAGRGLAPRPSPVEAAARGRGLRVETPVRLGAEETATLAAAAPDLVVTCAYGLILPRAVLDVARLGCVNVHASLLPRWRGAAPVQRAILAGDRSTGVTIFRLDEGVDTGPILLAEETPIGPEETAGDLLDRLAGVGARLLVRALAGLADGSASATPQPSEGASRAAKIRTSEARIDWGRPADEIDRLVRAMNPSPGAWTDRWGGRIQIWRTRLSPAAAAPGAWTVEAGDGLLEVVEAQREGRRRMPGAEVRRGLRLA